MRWRAAFFCLVVLGGSRLSAVVLPERNQPAADWRWIVLQQPLTITRVEFNQLREQALANPFLKGAADPVADLDGKPAPEAVSTLREWLRRPGAGSRFHLALGNRLWEQYIRGGDTAAGVEAVEEWKRWATAATAEPTRALRLAGRLAELELWEAAVPMLRLAADRCPPEALAGFREVARLFRYHWPELQAEFADVDSAVFRPEAFLLAVAAFECQRKDEARRLLGETRYLPGTWAGAFHRLRVETTATSDPLSLRSFLSPMPGLPSDPVWQVEMADAIAGVVGKERNAVVDGALAFLHGGGRFESGSDILITAACARLENRMADLEALLSLRTGGDSRGEADAAALAYLRGEQAARKVDDYAWSLALRASSMSIAVPLLDATLAALARGQGADERRGFFENTAVEVGRRIADKTPDNLGRVGLWFLLGARPEDAARTFLEGLKKADRLEERLALAYGLTVARERMGEDAVDRTVADLKPDSTNALLLALLVELAPSDDESRKNAGNLLGKAVALARTEDRMDELRGAVRILDLRGRDHLISDFATWNSGNARESSVSDLVARVRRDWPSLTSGNVQAVLASVVSANLAEFETWMQDMAGARAQTMAAARLKTALAKSLGSSGSGETMTAKEWRQRLLWSAYDDAVALEKTRQGEIRPRKPSADSHSIESGVWRHRFGEWSEISTVASERDKAWTTPDEILARRHERSISTPPDGLRAFRSQIVHEMRNRLERNDANAHREFRAELTRRLDAPGAMALDEHLLLLLAGGLGTDALDLIRDRLGENLLGLEDVAGILKVFETGAAFSNPGGPSETKRAEALRTQAASWLLERADHWPEEQLTAWESLVSRHLEGSTARSDQKRQLSELRARRRPAESPQSAGDPIDEWIGKLRAPKETRSVALNHLEQEALRGTRLTARQSAAIGSLALDWLFGEWYMMGLRTPFGMGPPEGAMSLDPDSAARALVLCSRSLAKLGGVVEAPLVTPRGFPGPGGDGPWLPTPADVLAPTHFLPGQLLLNFAHAENLSPASWRASQRAYAHEWRYQMLVRWLEEQARRSRPPDDIPFRLLALQLRWTGGERREAALRAKSWFGLSPHPELRLVACDLLRRANYDRDSVALAFGLLGANGPPGDRAVTALAQSLAKLPDDEQRPLFDKMMERDAMTALLAAAFVKSGGQAAAKSTPSDFDRHLMVRRPGDTSVGVARERRFLDNLRYDGHAACRMLGTELQNLRYLPRDPENGATDKEEVLRRWARRLQASHWLEAAARDLTETGSNAASPRSNAPGSRRAAPVGGASTAASAGAFFDLLRSIEPESPNPVWQIRDLAASENSLAWIRISRLENDHGDGVFLLEISADGKGWRQIEKIHWPNVGEGVSVGIINLSPVPAAYGNWKFEGFDKPDPYYWTWAKADVEAGRVPSSRYLHARDALPSVGTLPKCAEGKLEEAGDTFSGFSRQVLGTGKMTARIEVPRESGCVGVVVQKDWFPGGLRIAMTVDHGGRVQVARRFGQTDALAFWRKLRATETTPLADASWAPKYLQCLLDLHHDDEAWESVASLSDEERGRLIAGGGGGILAKVCVSREGQAAGFADRLLEMARLRPDDPKLRAGLAVAFKVLQTKLPATDDADRARRDAVEAFLAGRQQEESMGKGFTVTRLGYSMTGEAMRSVPRDAPLGVPLSAGDALREIESASRQYVPRTTAGTAAAALGTPLVDIGYHPDSGVMFRVVQQALNLRGGAGAARALEIFPLSTAAGERPVGPSPEPADAAARAGEVNLAIRSYLGLGLHLALGDADALAQVSAASAPMRSSQYLPPRQVLRQALASCCHAGGFEKEALEMQRALLKDLVAPFSSCWDYSFDVPLRLALWTKDANERREALDQLAALARKQRRAAPSNGAFQLALRKGAELLRLDHRDAEAAELEQIAAAEF